MYSLHNFIRNLLNKKITFNFIKNSIYDYYFYLKTLFNLGILFNVRKISNTHHNIFVVFYRYFFDAKYYFYKQALLSMYQKYYILSNSETKFSSYDNFLEENNFYFLLRDDSVDQVKALKCVYTSLYNIYFDNNKDKIFFKNIISWYLVIAQLVTISFFKGIYSVIFLSGYPYVKFRVAIKFFLYAIWETKAYWNMRYLVIVNNITYIKYPYLRNINEFFLNIYLISQKPHHTWLGNSVTLYLGVLKIYHTVRTIFLPIIISLFMLFLLINFFKIEIYTNVGIWGVLGFFFLWLMSGFNFFIKRYKNGKFTSAIQRFWKRTNSYFWLVEGFLFTLFFYYYLNSSQEPLYMYDESNLNQTFLPNLTSFYFSLILLFFIIFYSYYLLLNISTFSFKQQLTHLLINSVLMIYVFLLESYQFYYLVNTFFEVSWDYAEDIKTWVLETENPKIRVKTQYLMLALIAKYWHFIFIFFSWLFLLYKSYEKKKIHYSLFGFVIQNCIILVLLNILFCVQWLKWLLRRYYDIIYYWFFTDSNNWFLNDFTESFISLLGF